MLILALTIFQLQLICHDVTLCQKSWIDRMLRTLWEVTYPFGVGMNWLKIKFNFEKFRKFGRKNFVFRMCSVQGCLSRIKIVTYVWIQDRATWGIVRQYFIFFSCIFYGWSCFYFLSFFEIFLTSNHILLMYIT